MTDSKISAAQHRAITNHRKKLIRRELTINPDKHPAVADYIDTEQYTADGHRSFNQFMLGLIEQHIDSDSSARSDDDAK